MNKQPVKPQEGTNKTVFDHMLSTAVIKNGMVDTNDLLLVSPVFIAKGTGRVALISQDLDFAIKISPQQQESRLHWEIPLLIKGTFTSPDVHLNHGEIQKFLVRREIEKIKDKTRDQIKKHISGKAGEFLQNLISN